MTKNPSTTLSEQDFEGLLDRAKPKLRRILAQHQIPLADAEDVLQQAYLALVYQSEGVRDPEAWLVGTVRNKCLVYWRDRRRKIYDSVDSTILEWVAEKGNDLSDQERVDLVHDLSELVARLPERCRQVLEQRYQLGLEPQEVAENLGYQPSSISKITNRCLAALTRQMVLAGYCPPQEEA
jgi:RNA polymerase sigma-70 factor (ECF subfamily)